MKKLTSILVFVFCFAHFVLGQVIPKAFLETVNTADCIFEGQVIRSDSYWNADSTDILTSHTIAITKIFKGDMICGTVEVLNPGGRVGDRVLTLSHHVTLRTGEIGLFFCNGTNLESPQVDYYPETNSFELEITFSEQGVYKYYFDYLNHPVTGMFYNFDSLAQVYDLLELYNQVNYIDCQNPTVTFPAFNNEVYRKKRLNDKKNFVQKTQTETIEMPESYTKMMAEKLARISANKLLQTSDTLIYSLENEVVTGTTTKYLEFDIYLRANGNNTYFDNGVAHILFDPLVFGNTPTITVNRGTILMDVNTYDNPYVINVSTGVFAIPMNANLSPQNRYHLTTTSEQALHVKMEIVNCNTNTTISFTNFSMMQNVSLYATSPNDPTLYGYSTINSIDYFTNSLCLPYVSSISPTIIHAGVGELLHIHGKKFGNIQGNGLVGLPNANTLGNGYVFFDPMDSVLWSDTLIIYRVPWNVNLTVNGQVYSGVPGSGILFLRASTGDTATVFANDITVISNVFNEINDSVGAKLPILLSASLNSGGGYKFYPNSILKNNVNALSIVKKAVAEWHCFSDVNFTFDTTQIAKTLYAIDDTNSIVLGTTPFYNGSYVAGYTRTITKYCSTNNAYIAREIDIVLNKDQIWWYDSTALYSNSSSDTVDFYESVLHELGHGHQLGHVISADFSFPGVMFGGQHAGLRGLMPSDSCIKAAFTVKNNSNTPLGCGYSNHIFTPCGTNAIEIPFYQSSIQLYPVPVANDLHILFVEQPSRDFGIEITDILGRKLAYQIVPANSETIDVSYLPQGIYLFSVYINNQVYSSKIIKQ